MLMIHILALRDLQNKQTKKNKTKTHSSENGQVE